MRPLLLLILTACNAGAVDSASSPCSQETRATPLAAGAAFSGTSVTLDVIETDPEPATTGENIWLVALSSDGAPLEGCELSAAIAMPDHGHGGPVPSFSAGSGGEYTVEVSFTMGGYWEMDIDISCPDVTDTVQVTACVES